MPIEILKGLKICKCGNKGYAYRIGWKRPNGKIISWNKRKDYNQCKQCRDKMYKRIERKKRKNRLTSLNTSNKSK